jgi:hypothetical protein
MKKILLIFIPLLFIASCSTMEKPSKVHEEDENIYVILTNGTKKQLTFNKTDTHPILLPNNEQIVFIRNQNRSGYQTKKVMLVNIHDLKESTLTDQKPYKDGLDNTNDILRIESPALSLDGKYLLFVTEKYATGSQLVKVDLKTGVWVELFTAEMFEQIDKEPYKGYFLAGQSDVEDRGRDVYYRLLNDSGQIVKKFNDEESMKEFRNGLR